MWNIMLSLLGFAFMFRYLNFLEKLCIAAKKMLYEQKFYIWTYKLNLYVTALHKGSEILSTLQTFRLKLCYISELILWIKISSDVKNKTKQKNLQFPHKILHGIFMGWWPPTWLQIFYYWVCHATKFLMHFKELASWIIMEIFWIQLNSKCTNLCHKIFR